MQIPSSVYTYIYNSCLGINCRAVKAIDFFLRSDLKAWVAEGWELVPSRITELNSVTVKISFKEGKLSALSVLGKVFPLLIVSIQRTGI